MKVGWSKLETKTTKDVWKEDKKARQVCVGGDRRQLVGWGQRQLSKRMRDKKLAEQEEKKMKKQQKLCDMF